jgi:hypothetical protein
MRSRKLPAILLTALMLSALLAPPALMTPALAAEMNDQYNSAGAIDNWVNIQTAAEVGQEFKPNFDNITKAAVFIKGEGEVTLNIRDAAIFGTTVATNNKTVSSTGGAWYTFNVPYNPLLTGGYTYVIELVCTSGTVEWAQTDDDAYTPGDAVMGGVNQPDQDFRFCTYGDQAGSAYNLTVNVKPAGGTVEVSPPGGSYTPGTDVELKAEAAPGYTFYRWSGDVSGDASNSTITVNMNGNKTVNAHFYSGASPYATEVVSYSGPLGSAPYGDPFALLGKPATRAAGGNMRVKLVEPAYSVGPDKEQLITTLNQGSSIVVKFDHEVTNDPNNPYGIDFLVFGNAFFIGQGTVSDSTNMNTYMLTTGGFFENTKVSVKLEADDPWVTFDNGPYADSMFPTQAYQWDRANAVWTDNEMDFTKPVDPALTLSDFANISAADAIDLYNGSGGGTGFDLDDVGLNSIQYIKVEGLPGFSGGEIDAFSDVSPS